MRKGAAIIGAGGHARVIASILRSANIAFDGFFDDTFYEDEAIQGAPVLGVFDDVNKWKNQIDDLYLAIGDNLRRRDFFRRYKAENFHFPPLIHPNGLVENDAFIDEASVVCLGAILGTECKVGIGTIINTGAAIDHESEIGDFVHLAPKVIVAGRSRIGENTFVGMNASIADKIRIGKNVVIGAGSVVLKDVKDNIRVCGVYR